MAAVTTEMLAFYVKISWTEPSNNGAAITSYRVYIKDSEGVWQQETQFCNDQDAYDNRNCLVVTSVLKAPPYNLAQQALVEVQIQAYNLKGYGELSDANTVGAVVEGEPQAPSNLAYDPASTDDTQIVVSWDALTTEAEVGGPSATITSYNLQWDDGTGGASESDWVDLVGISPLSLLTSHTITTANAGVVPGTLYQLRVRA
jgi:hypothetical protein